MKNEKEEGLSEIEKAKIYLNGLIESHEQEILELKETYGLTNLKDFYYSEHRGTWVAQWHEGVDNEFDTKEGMITWIKGEGDE